MSSTRFRNVPSPGARTDTVRTRGHPEDVEERTLGEVGLVAESRENVSILDGVVVAGTENVGRDNGSEVVSELVVVGTEEPRGR